MNVCRQFVLGIGVLLLALGGSTNRAAAQTMQNWTTCSDQKTDPDETISACSIFIRTGRNAGGMGRLTNELLGAAFAMRAQGYRRKGEYALQISDSSRAIELGFVPWSMHGTRGAAYLMLGNRDRAMDDFTKAIQLYPKSGKSGSGIAGSYMDRGLLYAIKGDDERAAADYKMAMQLSPENRAPYEARIEILRRWISYLKEIQAEGDYENWSGPPLDLLRTSK